MVCSIYASINHIHTKSCRQRARLFSPNTLQFRKFIQLTLIHSAPKSNKPWSGSGKLNCRGTTSPNQMEAIFFGPPAGNQAKCGGGSSSRLTHARVIHKEVCALLLSALESLKMNLCEFCTVLPAQWATLTGSTQSVSTAETEQRLNKLVDSAKVCHLLLILIHTKISYNPTLGTRQRRRFCGKSKFRRCTTVCRMHPFLAKNPLDCQPAIRSCTPCQETSHFTCTAICRGFFCNR